MVDDDIHVQGRALSSAHRSHLQEGSFVFHGTDALTEEGAQNDLLG
ncbi:MAG: hypothetical protein HC888_18675 [Candidatus Competibacteraceae bacterium]|nr:hypothetical protein [Candidatus Competibacteraceae bacterium]